MKKWRLLKNNLVRLLWQLLYKLWLLSSYSNVFSNSVSFHLCHCPITFLLLRAHLSFLLYHTITLQYSSGIISFSSQAKASLTLYSHLSLLPRILLSQLPICLPQLYHLDQSLSYCFLGLKQVEKIKEDLIRNLSIL